MLTIFGDENYGNCVFFEFHQQHTEILCFFSEFSNIFQLLAGLDLEKKNLFMGVVPARKTHVGGNLEKLKIMPNSLGELTSAHPKTPFKKKTVALRARQGSPKPFFSGARVFCQILPIF